MLTRFPDINPKHLSLPAFGSRVNYRVYPSDESKWVKGRFGIVTGYFVQADGQVDGSIYVVDETLLVKAISSNAPPPRPIRTKDFQHFSPLTFPIAVYRSQALALLMTQAPSLSKRVVTAFRMFSGRLT